MHKLRICLGFVLLSQAAGGAPQAQRATGGLAAAVSTSIAHGRGRFSHERWGRLLKSAIHNHLVDYAALKRQRADLDAYCRELASAPLDTLAPDQLKALLINAYNAFTIQAILNHASVQSIREIPGVWDREKHQIGGFSLTLDEIEHRLLRPFFKDPRIHFAINCGSKSCAPIPPWSYEGDKLEAQLTERATSFLSRPENVRVEGGRLLVSRYFDWYAQDFVASGWVGSKASIADYVRAWARPEVAAFIDQHGAKPQVQHLEYNWKLNATPSPSPR
jgi:hypothetical protein